MLSLAEENYLKTIFKLQHPNPPSGLSQDDLPQGTEGEVTTASTNQIAEQMQTRAGSVSEMLKKLAEKELVHYQPYQGAALTEAGKRKAIQVVRRHRLWETFLVETLGFAWDKVHELAEELEHIRSEELTERLDAFLNHPKFDPHGDPIPNNKGEVSHRQHVCLNRINIGNVVTLSGVEDHDPAFLRYLESKGISIGASLKILERISFDGSSMISCNNEPPFYVSRKVAENLLVMS